MLIINGSIMVPGADPHAPRRLDLRIEGSRIAEVAEAGALHAAPGAMVIDAGGKLVVPGFVNAHHHSYDILAKGLLEDMPFDVWALHAQPAYFGPRSQAELRVRTLLGALENLKCGVTTLQDFCSLVPQDDATLDTVLGAYREIGIRTAFSIAVRDVAALDIAPFVPPGAPPEVLELVQGAPRRARDELDYVERQIARLRPLPPHLSWILSPAGPQRASFELLAGLGDLSARLCIPVISHVYETKAQAAKARQAYPEHGGSLIRRMQAAGLFAHRAFLAHMIWLLPDEIELLAELGGGVIHNPLANLKLKSGIAPLRRLREAGVPIALGCDNASCSDAQNIFQAMKMLCLLASGTDPEPTGLLALDAFEAATAGGARALGLEQDIGRIAPGMQADLALLDLTNIAYQPLNSAVRQMVYSDTGGSVDTVIVAGEVVLQNGVSTKLDEVALRAELADIMGRFRADFDTVSRRNRAAIPYLLEANRQVQEIDVGAWRYMCQCRRE
jgi:cytosine/adenosine deaminase-related metal-dependent hydrolase